MRVLKEHRCFGGVQGFYEHDSVVCGGPMRFAAYQPPQANGGRCPVVFYLSGLTCTEENFATKAGAQRVASALGLMLIAPDTSPRGTGVPGEADDPIIGASAGFYVDATEPPWASRYQMYRYCSEELPELVDRSFPTRGPDARSVFGHSMGGHGALVLGLRAPDRWRSISAFAPIAAPSECPWGEKAFTAYLGPDRSRWSAYDASLLVQLRQHPFPILIDQGTADPFLADQLLPERFRDACARAGQALTLRMQPGYNHSYYFIATFVEDHLQHHARALG